MEEQCISSDQLGISVSQEDFIAEAEGAAPVFASMPGLVEYWLGDEDNGVYGECTSGKTKQLVKPTRAERSLQR